MRWTDEHGAREFCPRTWTVRIVRPPQPQVVLSPAEEVALADLADRQPGTRIPTPIRVASPSDDSGTHT